MCKNGASKAKSPCTSLRSFKMKSDILKSSCDALRKALLYLLEQVVFSRFTFRSLFLVRKMGTRSTILYLPYSPRTVLATASLFAMLVLYQLLLKYTKCRYGELTVSLLFSAQRKHETRPPCISNGGGVKRTKKQGFPLCRRSGPRD